MAHVWHCKKFKTSTTSGKENYVIPSNDITGNDLCPPPSGGGEGLVMSKRHVIC